MLSLRNNKIILGVCTLNYLKACCKCSKISNTFLFLFSNRMWVIKAGIRRMLVRIANREDPGQTTSSEAV